MESLRGDDVSAMSQLAELLRQASEAGQNASRALAEMRRAYLPAGSYRETDPETLRRAEYVRHVIS